jgi:hypothetical protein
MSTSLTIVQNCLDYLRNVSNLSESNFKLVSDRVRRLRVRQNLIIRLSTFKSALDVDKRLNIVTKIYKLRKNAATHENSSVQLDGEDVSTATTLLAHCLMSLEVPLITLSFAQLFLEVSFDCCLLDH